MTNEIFVQFVSAGEVTSTFLAADSAL